MSTLLKKLTLVVRSVQPAEGDVYYINFKPLERVKEIYSLRISGADLDTIQAHFQLEIGEDTSMSFDSMVKLTQTVKVGDTFTNSSGKVVTHTRDKWQIGFGSTGTVTNVATGTIEKVPPRSGASLIKTSAKPKAETSRTSVEVSEESF